MIQIIIAAVILGNLYLSIGGYLWATNAIIAILALSAALVLYSIAIVVGFQKTILMNSEKRIEELKTYAEKVDTRTLFILRAFLLLCVWHIYTLGYVLFAGIAGTTVTISIVVMLLRSIDMAEGKKE